MNVIPARGGRIAVWGTICLLSAVLAHAQLTDMTQTTPNMPGGGIGKSLEQQVGGGQGDEDAYGSSIYLIRRDPARAIRRGRQLFQRKFTIEQGLGPRVSPDSVGNIQDHPAFGAGLSDSCAACHGRPRGSAGFGGDVATRPDSRDAPHLFGLGLVEMLADEITSELRAIRDAALEAAASQQEVVRSSLKSKGIHYGHISTHPDGTVDTSEVEGVDADLRIRPFSAQGGTISMREFIVGAFKAEMGMEVFDPLLCAVTDQNQLVVSMAGMMFDPALDTFERPPVCSRDEDGDGDGVHHEVDAALIDYMEFYFLNYFKPGRSEVSSFEQEGFELFDEIGCTSCHVQNLTIDHDRRVADVETQFDREKGGFNHLFATATTLFDVVPDGDPFPQLLPRGDKFVVQNIFTDLKRHDLGPKFHERNYDGTLQTHFVTEPLWGVGTSAPYGHDGRSIDLKEVILRHGGEAEQSRLAFQERSRADQRKVLGFLQSLVLFPPDDTSSNLNPGVEGGHPQTEHGSINLSALFQIEAEGVE